jgi:hypothetical protein
LSDFVVAANFVKKLECILVDFILQARAGLPDGLFFKPTPQFLYTVEAI